MHFYPKAAAASLEVERKQMVCVCVQMHLQLMKAPTSSTGNSAADCRQIKMCAMPSGKEAL